MTGAPASAHADIDQLDDDTVRVLGVLSPEDRARLELTHFETGGVRQGWSIWCPKEVDDDS